MTDKPKLPPESYEVGYGKPPKHTRFKPGQSGCPGGASKMAKVPVTAKERAAKILKRRIRVAGRKRATRLSDLMVESMGRKAAQGDVAAFRAVWPLIEGTAAFGKRKHTLDEMASSLTPEEKVAVNEIRAVLEEIVKSDEGSASKDVPPSPLTGYENCAVTQAAKKTWPLRPRDLTTTRILPLNFLLGLVNLTVCPPLPPHR